MATPSNEHEAVVITGLGLMTSVGHQVAQAVTSLRANIMRLEEFPEYEPIVREPGVYVPEPLIAAPVTGISDGLIGIERLFALGVPPLQEAVADAGLKELELQQTILLVAGGQHEAVADGSRVAALLAPRLAMRLAAGPLLGVHYLPRGTAGVLIALRQAIDLLQRRVCLHCVVGGVHSWLDPDTLAWLDRARRLKCQENVDAFVPGEAGAFVVLELAGTAARRKQPAYAECVHVVVGNEENSIWADKPCTGEVLSECVRSVVGDLGKRARQADVLLCDLNGESYRATEASYALSRAFRNGQAIPPVVHPADCIGDVGAAIGAILLSLAAFTMTKGLSSWKNALICCSSDDGERAACAVTGANKP